MQAWTQAEYQYLRDHSHEQEAAEIAIHLGRSESSVHAKRAALGLKSSRPPWSQKDEAYLMDKWGTLSIPAIAKHLGRTVNAVKVRVARLGLGPSLMGGEYVTLNQLVIAVTGTSSAYSYKMKSWVENRGLPIHTKRVDKCSWRVVYLDEFWPWAEKTAPSSTFPRWSRWRWVKNLAGLQNSGRKTLKPTPSRGKTRGARPRTHA